MIFSSSITHPPRRYLHQRQTLGTCTFIQPWSIWSWVRLTEFVDLNSYRSSHPEVFLEKGVLNICSKFAGEHPCRSAISINLLCNFIEIALRHGCSPANLLHIPRTPFLKTTSEWLLLYCSFNLFVAKRSESLSTEWRLRF